MNRDEEPLLGLHLVISLIAQHGFDGSREASLGL